MAYMVQLKAVGNPDFRQAEDIGVPAMPVFVSSIEEAQDECRKYIAQYDLGGGNWADGKVFKDIDDEWCYVGYISYNGRFWPHAPNALTEAR